jgi:hypothetical protein
MHFTLGREQLHGTNHRLYAKQKGIHVYGGASIFDPVLCELLYKWFCTNGGSVLNHFAGSSVRLYVAGILGIYNGIDLRWTK